MEKIQGYPSYLGNCYVIGPTGATGPTGAPGPANITINVNSTITGEPGTDASVNNIGTETDVLLDFVIPRGEVGPPPILTIGNVTTGLPGSQASIKITPIFLNSDEREV